MVDSTISGLFWQSVQWMLKPLIWGECVWLVPSVEQGLCDLAHCLTEPQMHLSSFWFHGKVDFIINIICPLDLVKITEFRKFLFLCGSYDIYMSNLCNSFHQRPVTTAHSGTVWQRKCSSHLWSLLRVYAWVSSGQTRCRRQHRYVNKVSDSQYLSKIPPMEFGFWHLKCFSTPGPHPCDQVDLHIGHNCPRLPRYSVNQDPSMFQFQ